MSCFPFHILLGFVVLTARISLSTSQAPKPIHVEKSGCPETKGCYSFPDDCKSSKDCDFLLTYVPGKDKVSFSMSAKGEYVAMGFNDKPQMDDTDTVICFKSRIGHTIGHFSLIGHDTPKFNASNPASLAPVGMKGTAVSMDDGVIKCSFERQKTPTKYMKYDLNKKLFLIFARGKVNSKFIKEHTWKDSSWRKVNVSTTLDVEGREFDLLLAHAGFMFLAWIGFATVGMFTSRYRKTGWGDKKLFNSNLWFRIHQGCMLLTVLFTIIGVILIFIHVGGWADRGAHPFIGLITIVLMLVQPIMAFFRPDPQAYSRFLFTRAHRVVGLIAFVLAIVNCFLGVNMVEDIKVKGNAILSVFLVLLVIVIILYQVFLFHDVNYVIPPFTIDGDEINTPADQDVHEESTMPQTTTEKRDSTLRDVAYYFVVLLCLSCSLGFVIVLGTVY